MDGMRQGIGQLDRARETDTVRLDFECGVKAKFYSWKISSNVGSMLF